MADIRKLPRPLVAVWEWQIRGACRGADVANFFHPDRERGLAHRRREIRARAVCQGCPVIAECRSHALAVEEPYGVWGGLTERDRDRILRSRSATAPAIAGAARGA